MSQYARGATETILPAGTEPVAVSEDAARTLKAGTAIVANPIDRVLGVGHYRAVTLVLLLGLVVFANSLVNDFVFDDRGIILNNPYIRHFRRLSIIFRTGYWPDPRLDLLYRPLVIASYALNYTLGGFAPWGYHLVNIVLHAVTGAVAYALLWSLFHNKRLAFLSAVVFALHPIHTEAVANVVGRAELLAAFFFFLAWIAYLRARETLGSKRIGFLASSILCFALALISKEHAAVLLGALVLSDLLRVVQGHPNASLREVLRSIARPLRMVYPWYLAAFALYLLVRYQVLGALRTPVNAINFVDNPLTQVNLLTRLFTATKILGRYLWLLLVPQHLSADYSYNTIPLSRTLWEPAVLVSLLVLLLMVAFAVMARRRQPVFAFALLFFGAAILPVSNLVFLIGTMMAERTMYLPSIAFCLAFGAAVDGALRWAASRSKAVVGLWLALFVGICALYSAKTVLRNRVWRDDVVFAEAALRGSPNSVKIHRNFGAALSRVGRLDEAKAELETALRIYPDYYQAYIDLGIVLSLQGKFDEAIEAFKKAASFWANYADPYYHMGKIYEQRGQRAAASEAYRRAGESVPIVNDTAIGIALALFRLGLIPEAQRQLEEAIWRNPESVEARNNLGLVYLGQGRLKDARFHLQVAAHLRANSPEIWTNLGKVLYRQGQVEYAKVAFERALNYRADYADAKQNLGTLLMEQGRVNEAANMIQEALRLDPKNAEAHNNLGASYGRQGRVKEAERAFQTALQIQPRYAEAHYNLGTLYAKQGRLDEARRELEAAIRLKPQYPKAHYNLGVLLQQLGQREGAKRQFQIARQQGLSPEGLLGAGSTP